MSVLAVQDKETEDAVVPVTLRFVGTDGGVVLDVIVTVVWAVTDPPPFVAVKMYVVVALGLTAIEVMPVTLPMPLFRLRVPPFVVVHDKVLVCPDVIEAGLAEKDGMVGAVGSVEACTAADWAELLPAAS